LVGLIQAGFLIRDQSIAQQLAGHFEQLLDRGYFLGI
jgi:hypothetical protein